MRLDDFDPNINVEDQRGRSFGGGGFGGGGSGLVLNLLPLVYSRFGCLGVMVVVIAVALFSGMFGLGGGGGGTAPSADYAPSSASRGGGTGASSACAVDANSRAACNAFSSADKTWAAYFQQQGKQFARPKLVFYGGNGQSGCGAAQAAMGPFYCPQDQGIYLDTSFFKELSTKFGAAGDFAEDYVMAHEFGHHIQNLLGISDQVTRQQRSSGEREGNALSVKLELQADCFAGVWAAMNRTRMEPGDLEEGLRAANAIGDDTLQKEAQGRVVPDSFTHGTSAQRMKWLRIGIDTGDPGKCDTFNNPI